MSLNITACVELKTDEVCVVVTSDGNGNLQSEIPYISKDVIHGLAKYYYFPTPKNVLKDEIELKNGKKEGWHKHYRKDGTLESKIYFKNNLPDEPNYWYFENGQTASQSFWVKNNQYGNAMLNYINGKSKHFYSLDFFGNTVYVIKWDSLGDKVKDEGVVFSPEFVVVYASDSTETPIVENEVKAGKEIVVKVTVAQPPQTETVIRMGELHKGDMKELSIKNYTAIYKRTFIHPGRYTLVTAGEIRNVRGNVIKHDSLALDLIVGK